MLSRTKIMVSMLLILILFLFLSVDGGVGNRAYHNDEEIPEIISIEKGAEVCALYPSYDNLSKMIDETVLVVKGKVMNQFLSENEVATYSVVEVENTLKGEIYSEIKVLQLNSDHVLESDRDYILFLGEQGQGYDDDFFIVGGIQGISVVSDKGIEFYEMTMNDSFAKEVEMLLENKSLSVETIEGRNTGETVLERIIKNN